MSLPRSQLRRRGHPPEEEVWDPVRKRWVQLGPEEEVRQQLIQHLNQDCGVPLSLMAVERAVPHPGGNRLRGRRYDLLVHNRRGEACLLAETKAPDVPLREADLAQAADYNRHTGCRWLILTNGPQLVAMDLRPVPCELLGAVPPFEVLAE